MSTHIVGFRPPDAKWKQMKAVWCACKAAGIPAPDEVCKFFEYEAPDEKGVSVKLQGTTAIREWKEDEEEGFEVLIERLPKDVNVIRFYNSY